MSGHLRLIGPRHVNRSVPVRPANDQLRPREYLTPAEIDRLMKAARDGRYGHRDATIILIAYRHGLRAIEICDLEWSQIEFGRTASLHVWRAKNGKPSVHPLRGDELRALRELQRQLPDSAFVFPTERGGPFTPDAVNGLIKRIGKRAELPFQVHCHMLRHARGYALANAGHDTRRIQDWLGHRSIQHAVRYRLLLVRRARSRLHLDQIRPHGLASLHRRHPDLAGVGRTWRVVELHLGHCPLPAIASTPTASGCDWRVS
jgi:integrase